MNTSIENFISGTTFRDGRERDLDIYQAMCGIKAQELAGKVVLDLGSGEKQLFAQELNTHLAENGLQPATILSLNPDFARFPEYRKQIAALRDATPELIGHSFAATAQRLPVADNSIDVLIASYSITVFSLPKYEYEQAQAWAQEVGRVLKPGGIAYLTPVDLELLERSGYDRLFRIWWSMGLLIGVYNVPTIDLLGEWYEIFDEDLKPHRVRRSRNESLFSTLIIKKPDN